MPYQYYVNTKKPIVFDVNQVGLIKRVLDLVSNEGLFWVGSRRWFIDSECLFSLERATYSLTAQPDVPVDANKRLECTCSLTSTAITNRGWQQFSGFPPACVHPRAAFRASDIFPSRDRQSR